MTIVDWIFITVNVWAMAAAIYYRNRPSVIVNTGPTHNTAQGAGSRAGTRD